MKWLHGVENMLRLILVLTLLAIWRGRFRVQPIGTVRLLLFFTRVKSMFLLRLGYSILLSTCCGMADCLSHLLQTDRCSVVRGDPNWHKWWAEVHPNFIDDIFLLWSFHNSPRVIGSSPASAARSARMLQPCEVLDDLSRSELFCSSQIGPKMVTK
jgi:hypothetical protein